VVEDKHDLRPARGGGLRELQTRDKIIVCAQRWYGIFHIAEFALLVGVKLKDVPPSIGILQEVLSQYGLTAEG
jgi:hypothetical protein